MATPGLGRTVLELATDSTKFFGDLDKVEKRTTTLRGAFSAAGKDLKGFGTEMTSVGKALTIGLSAPLVAAGGVAVKFALDFNKAMANVATLIPGNTARVNELKVSVQDMAIATGKSTGDLADGLYQVISAFGDTADTVHILEINARAAAAGLATTTDAINLTSAVTKGYGDTSAEAVQKASDLAFVTVKLGQTTFPELAASIGEVIPVGAALGATQEELFAGFATLTGVTGNAASVSTQLSAILRAMIKPTDDMAGAIKRLGYDGAQALVSERGVVGALRALIGTTDGSQEAIGKLFGRAEALTAVFALSGGQAEVFDTKLQQVRQSAGATDEAFREQAEGVNKAGFQWEQFKQQAVVAAQKLGDELLPVILDVARNLKPLVDKVVDGVKAFGDLPDPLKKTAIGIGLVAIVAGPAAIFVGKLALAMDALAASKGLAILGALAGKLGTAAAAAGVAGGLIGGYLTNALLGAAMGGRDFAEVQGDIAKVLGQSGGIVDQRRGEMLRFATSIDVVAKVSEDAKKPIRELTEEQKKALEAQKKLRDQLFGEDDIRKAQAYIGALGNVGAFLRLTSDAQEDVRKTLDKAVAAYLAAGRVIPEMVRRWYTATHDWSIETGKLADLIEDKYHPALEQQQLLFIQSTEGIEYNTGALADLADETGNWGGLLEGTNVIVGQGIDDMREWGEVTEEVLRRLPGLVADAFTGGGGLGGALKGIGSMLGSQYLGRAFEGFAKNMSSSLGALMPAIGQALGSMIGPVVDLLFQAFGKHTEKDIARRAGFEWGVQISEGLRDAIAKDAKNLFRGGEVEAMVYNLAKVIDEAGGVTTKSIGKWATALRDVFVFVERGSMTSEQAVKALNETFPKLAAAVEAAGGVASREFLELIDLAQRFGLESQAITDFLSSQAAKIGTGLAAQLAPFTTQYEGLGEKIKAAREDLAKLDAETAGKEELGVEDTQARELAVARLTQLLEEQKAGAEAVAGAYDRVGLSVLASYNAGVAKGLDQLTLMEQLGPALDHLVTLNQELGVESQNAAIQELVNLRNKITANAELVTAATTWGETYAAMINLGVRDADALSAMQQQGVANYEALIAAGFTETEALVQIKGGLEAIRDAHEELEIPIDENTEALIAQAEAAGVLGEKQVSAEERAALAMERTADVLERIARKMGVEIPAAADTMATKVGRSIDKIPKTIPIQFEWENAEPPDLPEHGGFSGGAPPGDVMHRGGLVLHKGGMVGAQLARAHAGLYVGLGADEVPIIARRGEGVLSNEVGMPNLSRWALEMLNAGAAPPAGEAGAIGTAVVDAMMRAGMGGTGPLSVTFNGALRERWVREELMPEMLAILRKGGGTLTDWQGTLRT